MKIFKTMSYGSIRDYVRSAEFRGALLRIWYDVELHAVVLSRKDCSIIAPVCSHISFILW